MIIKEVRTRHIRAPWVEPPVFGVVVPENRDVLVAEIETTSGIVGMGYLILLRGGVPTVRACLDELVIPEIIGRDATDIAFMTIFGRADLNAQSVRVERPA